MANMLNPYNWFSNNQNVDNKEERHVALDKAIRKASMVNSVGDTRSEKTNRLAVSTITPDWVNNSGGNTQDNEAGFLGYWASPSFRDYLRFTINDNKHSRIRDFRDLGKQEKLEACVHEYAISCIASHDNEDPVKGEIKGDYNEEVKDIINKEIAKIIDYFKFDLRGQKYFKEFLKTGELVFENVISYDKPELGVLDVKAIPPENVEPIYRNEYNEEIEAFILLKPANINDQNGFSKLQQTAPTFDTLPMACSQLTYCNSGEYDEVGCRRMVKPFIMKGQDAQKKLSLIEDAIVINAMTNGPERLLWQFPTGHMGPAEKNRYMQNVINGLKKKKGADANGNIIDKFNPISITEDYYVPIDKEGQSAKVERVQGSQAFSNGFNSILTHFHNNVYEDMHVPITRLNPDAGQSDGQTITMQELAFAERVIDIQKRFAEAVKKTLITHLKLKGIRMHTESCENSLLEENTSKVSNQKTLFEHHLKLIESGFYGKVLTKGCGEEKKKEYLHEIGESYWDQFELKEKDIKVKFSLPTTFLSLREQQQFDLKFNNFNQMATSGFFSVYLLAKEYLSFTDSDIQKHLAWRKMEAEKTWELTNVEGEGPDFRSIAASQAGLDGGSSALGGGSELGGGDLGGGLDGGDSAPDFGGDDGLDDLDGGGEALDDLPPEDGETPEPEPETEN